MDLRKREFAFPFGINVLVFISEWRVHCAVRAESFNANKVNLSYQSVKFVK